MKKYWGTNNGVNPAISLRSLSNDIGNVSQESEMFDKQNNNSARASRFLVHFFAVTARLRTKIFWIHYLWRTKTQYDDFRFVFSKVGYGL